MTTLLLAESYLHRLDPYAVEAIGLRWYGLAYAAGFLVAWVLLRWMAASGRTSLTVQDVGDLMFSVIAGVIVGGRLGYVIFYRHGAPFVEFIDRFPWWELLAINLGGMSAHGGMIGVVVACWLFARRRKISPLHLFDLVAVGATPGLCLGRLANFVNAELWGRPLPAAWRAGPGGPPWWSVKYPDEVQSLPIDAATFERLADLVGGGEGFLQRVVVSAKAGRPEVIEAIRPLLTAHYPSQIFQAITDGPVLLAILAIVWLRPRRPGVVGSWFLIAYGVLRIATEMFRQADEGVALLLGLSRGQVLSVLMVAIGIACLVFAARRPAAPLGGLIWKKEDTIGGSTR